MRIHSPKLIAIIGPTICLALTANGQSAAPPLDPIARLQKQIDTGQVQLAFDPRHGYLPAVLKALGVPPASQTLVFSKTSFQFKHISPKTPRALYFNDDAVVGWVPGGEVMEVAAVSPGQGTAFYLLPQQKTAKPRFVRQKDECLQCHQGSMTQGVPGFFMRSVYAGIDGRTDARAASFITTDRSDFEERWGGWYVTGTHGQMRHMGNVFATRPDAPDQIDRDAGANVSDLSRYLDTSQYLQKTSDIVALMVAEHQCETLNLIARAAQPLQPGDNAVEKLVQALLFSRETRLKDDVRGSAAFVTAFQARGLKDRKGRSLREFDLKTRLFRYPCSYLIYSRAFDALPPPVKQEVYRRLDEVLTGKDRSEPFTHLTDADRQAIREILMDTKPEFAAAAGS